MDWRDWLIVLVIVAGSLVALQSIVELAVYRAILRYEALRRGATGAPGDVNEVLHQIRGEATDRL